MGRKKRAAEAAAAAENGAKGMSLHNGSRSAMHDDEDDDLDDDIEELEVLDDAARHEQDMRVIEAGEVPRRRRREERRANRRFGREGRREERIERREIRQQRREERRALRAAARSMSRKDNERDVSGKRRLRKMTSTSAEGEPREHIIDSSDVVSDGTTAPYNVTESEARMIQDLRAMCRDVEDFKDMYLTDLRLMQFLCVAKWDRERAFQRVHRFREAEKMYGVNGDHKVHATEKEVLQELELGKINPVPPREGTLPCIIVRVALHNPEAQPTEVTLKAGTLVLFNMLNYEVAMREGVIGIFDMQGFGLKNMHFVPERRKAFFDFFQQRIPVRIKKFCIVNSSYFMTFALNIVKPFLSQKLRDRFETKHQRDVVTWVPPEFLPQHLGGKKEFCLQCVLESPCPLCEPEEAARVKREALERAAEADAAAAAAALEDGDGAAAAVVVGISEMSLGGPTLTLEDIDAHAESPDLDDDGPTAQPARPAIGNGKVLAAEAPASAAAAAGSQTTVAAPPGGSATAPVSPMPSVRSRETVLPASSTTSLPRVVTASGSVLSVASPTPSQTSTKTNRSLRISMI